MNAVIIASIFISCFLGGNAARLPSENMAICPPSQITTATLPCGCPLAQDVPASLLAFKAFYKTLHDSQCLTPNATFDTAYASLLNSDIAAKVSLAHADHDHVFDHEQGHDHDHQHGHSSQTGHKVGAMFLLFGVAALGAAAPYFLQRRGVMHKIMPYTNSFACGAFLGLALFHLLPESVYVTKAAGLNFDIGHGKYNITFILSFIGFAFMILIEKVLLVAVAAHDDTISHCHHVTCDEECPVLPSNSVCAITDDLALSKAAVEKKDCHAGFSPGALLTCLSIAVHALFEGLVVGMFDDAVTVWVAALSIAGHKWAEGFSIAVNCIRKGVEKKFALLYLAIVILASPIGILIGFAVIGNLQNSALEGVLNGLCVGIILYTACELLFEEMGSSKKVLFELMKFLCMVGGAGVVLGLMLLHVAEGSHNHND